MSTLVGTGHEFLDVSGNWLGVIISLTREGLGGVQFNGTVNAAAANPTAAGVVGTPSTNWLYYATNGGTTAFGIQVNIGDFVIYNGSNWQVVNFSSNSGGSGGFTGILTPSQGGTGLNTYDTGDMLYADTPISLRTVHGNKTTTKKFLTQTGTGLSALPPNWDTISITDVAEAAPLNSPTFTGTPTAPTPSATDSSNSIATTEFVVNAVQTIVPPIAFNYTLQGDVTGSSNSSIITTILKNVNTTTGTFGSSINVPVITVNAKGLITDISTSAISVDWSDINNKPTIVSLDSPHFIGNPTAPTQSIGDSSTSLATTEFVVNEVLSAITSPLLYKGTVDITNVPPTNLSTGYLYRVIVGGTPNSGYTFSTPITTIDIGDYAVYNGSTWDRFANINPSVNSGTNIIVTPTGDTSYSVALQNSPNFTGNVTAPTVTATDNSTKIATTAFVKDQGYLLNNQNITLQGAVIGSGSNIINTSLATVNTTTGTFGSTTAIPIITVDAQGLVTAVDIASISIPSMTWGNITGTPTTLAGYGITDAALLASPHFTGSPKSPTLTITDNSSAIATTAFVQGQGYITNSALTPFAPLNSPVFTGNATAPTVTVTDNSITLATTAYVKNQNYITSSALTTYAPLNSPAFTGNPTAPTLTITDNSSAIATTAFVKGVLPSPQTITLTGAVTGSGTGSFVTTLATVNATTGTFGSSSLIPVITTNAQGLITNISTATASGGSSSIPTPNYQTGTSYTIQTSDNNLTIWLANVSAITVTIPNSLLAGFSCTCVQDGAGQITFVAASGTTMHNRQSQYRTAGQWAGVSLECRSNVDNVSAVVIVCGDTTA